MDQQIPSVEVTKKIQFFQNGIWKECPHLLFLWNLCQRKPMWFEFHVNKMKKEKITKAGGFTFRFIPSEENI